MEKAKQWRKMLEDLGRGYVIYITPDEKELLLLSLRQVDTLKEARLSVYSETFEKTEDGPKWITIENGIEKVEPYNHQDGQFSNMCAYPEYCRCSQ